MLRYDLHDCREPGVEVGFHLKAKFAVDTGAPAMCESRTIGLKEIADKIGLVLAGMNDSHGTEAVEREHRSVSICAGGGGVRDRHQCESHRYVRKDLHNCACIASAAREPIRVAPVSCARKSSVN